MQDKIVGGSVSKVAYGSDSLRDSMPKIGAKVSNLPRSRIGFCCLHLGVSLFFVDRKGKDECV